MNTAIVKKQTKKTAPINGTGLCFESLLKKIEKKHNITVKNAVQACAINIIQDCVSAYSARFGSGDVGANGTGTVTSPFTPTPGEKIPNRTTGLIYGKVQSGKTNAAMAAVALGLANGFRAFVVLTSDNVLLGKQTLSRFRASLGHNGPRICGWQELTKDPAGFGAELKSNDCFQDTGVVFVSTKNRAHLASVLATLKASGAARFPTLIIDDEADHASLNTHNASNAKKGLDEVSAIFGSIGDIRRAIPNHIYLQLTATPQSLLLQSIDHPSKPVFCVLVPPGDGYIGGDIFFSEDATSLSHRVEVDAAELNQLKGESGEINPGGKTLTPKGLRKALCTFFLGAAQKMLEEDDDERRYTLLVHISQKRQDFKYLKEVIQQFTSSFDKALRGKLSKTKEQEAIKWLTEAHAELAKTCRKLYTLDVLIARLKQRLTNVSPVIIDSDAASGDVDYREGMNILVGGNRLGRGLTIDGLMVTYYGRDPKTPMGDTVHQHARMFGYRGHLLDVTRIFSAPHLLDGFKSIHESDQATRKAIGDDPDNLLVKPVWIGVGIKPTRSNVLNPADVGAITPGRELYPRQPKWKRSEIDSDFKALDTLLSSYTDDSVYYQVPISLLMSLLKHMPSLHVPTSDWEDQRVLEVLKAINRDQMERQKASASGAASKLPTAGLGRLNVRRGSGGRGLGLSRKTVDAGTGFLQSLWVKKARDEFPNEPTLIIAMEEGRKEEHWEGSRVYLPTLIVPNSEFVFVFNYA